MRRHSDRKAFLEQRERHSLQWSSRTRDGDRDPLSNDGKESSRDDAEDGATFASQERHPHHQHPGTLLSDTSTLAGGASPQPENEQRTPVLNLSNSPAIDVQGSARKGRLVPVGEHHEGSFGVYMAHKMEKLRDQVDGAVPRLEGPEGSLFRGVVVYINGFLSTPVATIRELLVSRGGTVEAYNTSRCTHMICESLPAAKIRELRKLRHPPPVVRSAWVEDSVRSRRKLPVAGYMVEGIFVQKGTLAASFAAAKVKSPSDNIGRGEDGRSINSTTKRSQNRVSGGAGAVVSPSHASKHGPSERNQDRVSIGAGMVVSAIHAARHGSSFGSNVGPPAASSGRLADRGPSATKGAVRGSQATQGDVSLCAAVDGPEPPQGHLSMLARVDREAGKISPASDSRVLLDGAPSLASSSTRPASDAGAAGPSSPLVFQAGALTANGGGTPSDGLLGESEAYSETEGGGGDGRSGRARLKPDDAGGVVPPFELPDMGAAGESGRSTKDDPAFMKTFFQNSRLHYIGVGRARAVKLVNAGLAARAEPGGTPPVFSGKLGRGQTRVILHVDMDCFFVSVLVKNRPELRDKAVAVAHNASNAKGAGSSEISSCNYLARAKGLKAGMFMMQAKKLCPELVVLRYDFDAYSEASDTMYGIFLRYAPVVMAVSCDEAFLELPEGTNPMTAATQIRRSILKETGCPASAGASNCMLLARMATKEAKPNGQFWLPPEAATQHMGPLPVQDLPGVGWKLRRRLNEEGFNICSDLWPLSAAHLQKGLALGEKTGQALWEACRGIDKRPVQAPPDRKSIGAEVNYGVRFDTQDQANGFLSELALELSRRMAAEGVVGRALTLKIMKQRDGVGLPRKYLGHGICDARSKLLNLQRATGDAGTLASSALQLLKEAKVPPDKIRGIGLQMTRLGPASAAAAAAAAGEAGGGGGSGASGGRAVGGLAGGALRGWLIKPGETYTTSGSQTTTTTAKNAMLPVRETGADERTVDERNDDKRTGDERTVDKRTVDEQTGDERTIGERTVNEPTVDERTVASVGANDQKGVGIEPPRGGGGGAPLLLTEESDATPDGIGNRSDLPRKPAWTGGPQPPPRRASDKRTREEPGRLSNKRPRDETSEEGRTPPREDALHPAARHRSDSPSRIQIPVGGASAAGTGTWAGARAGVEAGAGAWARSGSEAGAGEGGGGGGRAQPHAQSADSALQQKVLRPGPCTVDVTAETSFTPSPGKQNAEAGPSRWNAPVEESRHEEESLVDSTSVVRGDVSPWSAMRRRRRRESPSPGPPEMIPSPSPLADGVAGTPASGAGTPSMSQITFSQIDSTVLGALPPELRREVMDQLEARQRERRGSIRSVSSSPAFPSSQARARARVGQELTDDAPSPEARARARVGQQLAVDSPAGTPAESPASAAGHTRVAGQNQVAGHNRVRPASVRNRLEVVREGFDLTTAREGSARPQQVSIDSLWTLRKLRDDDSNDNNDGEGREGPSAFYRESLRAMPLGLGLQYASLSENQRAQIARRYAQTPENGAGSAADEVEDGAGGARASDDAVVADSDSIRLPPSPSPASFDKASVRRGGGGGPTSPRLGAPRSPLPFGGGAPSGVEAGGAACSASAAGTTPVRRSLPRPPRSSEEGLLHRVSLSQIDRDVLDCLPQEVREEVLRAIVSTPTGDAAAAVDPVAAGGGNDSGSPVLGDAAESAPSSVEAQARGDSDLESGVSDVELISPKLVPQRGSAGSLGGRGRRDSGGVFEAEKMDTLRGALRVWIGGAVPTPSQWHLELLYRYLEELVEGGRLDETATVLRCIRRLSSKAGSSHVRPGSAVSSPPTDGGGGSGWVSGYRAVLEAVQELVRRRTGGATLSLIC